jgi:hypothetical protein
MGDSLCKAEYCAIDFKWQNPTRAWLADGEERAREGKACLSQSGRNLQRELRHESKFLIFFALNPLKKLDSEK